MPIPLLVLGGMSILLLAAGGLGYVSRRRQAAHADDFDGDDSSSVARDGRRGPGGYNQWVVCALIYLQIADKFSVGTAPYSPLPARMTNVAHPSGKS